MAATDCEFQVDERVRHRLVPAASAAAPDITLVVGAAILHPTPAPPRVLLVQRSATEHFFPGMYELPGGKVEPGDATILHAVARETAEETGLRVARVVRETPGFEYTTRKGASERVSRQLNFVVEVDGVSVRLNPEEHQRWVWAAESEVGAFPMTEEMVKVVRDVFDDVRAAAEHGELNERLGPGGNSTSLLAPVVVTEQ